jgi:hypothetical protein
MIPYGYIYFYGNVKKIIIFNFINIRKSESFMEQLNQLDILRTKLHKRKNPNILPGQTYRLPSLGKSYPPGVLSDDVTDGEIILYPMTTLDEICVKTPDMLFQGTAVEEVLKRRAPQILQPLELLPKDVDYILSALRQITYGDTLEINFTCSHKKCGHKNHKAATKISNFLRKAKTLDSFDPSKLEFQLDGFMFKIKFSTYGEMVKLNQQNMNNSMSTPEEIYSVYVGSLAMSIESIDGCDDKEVIHSFLYNDADSVFQHKLLNYIQAINEWGVEFKQDFVCEKCGEITTLPIEINPVSFFSPPSDQAI